MTHPDPQTTAAAATTAAAGGMSLLEMAERGLSICCMVASLIWFVISVINWLAKQRKK